MNPFDLNALKAAMDGSRRDLDTWLVAGSLYLEKLGREGDPLARWLAERIEAAFDAMNAEAIAAQTVVNETQKGEK